MIRILLVEDNIKISENVRDYLQGEFEVQPVYSAEEALIYLQSNIAYDLIILDLMLPGKDGLSVLNYVSSEGMHLGVIILTAKEDLGDKLKAFNLGANDYLTKPFFLEELKARINAILKTLNKIENPNHLRFKEMILNMHTRALSIQGVDIGLNERMYLLLEYLMLNKGILLFKEQLFERICGYDSDASTDIIEVYISKLRKLLSPFGYDKYIITKRGMGYILEENAG